MKRLVIIIGVLIIAAVAVAAALVVLSYHRGQIPAATPEPRATATPAATPNPLSIASVRAHPIKTSLISTTQSLPERGGCTTTVVSFTSDGLTEYALLEVPTSVIPADGYPVVILAHGYIDPAAYQTTGSDYQGFINAFCGAGYAVFKLDYRGNAKSGGTPTVGDIDPAYTYDLLNLTASLTSRSDLNASKVVWLGHSMGGAVVLRAAVASHNLPVKAIILASGVVGSLDDTINNWPANMFPADLMSQKAAFVATNGTPNTNPSFWHDTSAINYVGAITAPVEINHGTADTVVPIAFSQHLDNVMTSAGKPHIFYQYPGGDHQYSTAGSSTAFLKNSLNFLAQTIK